MSELGVLFLPSGPGLSSGPAQVFLTRVFAATGKTIFWNEPSVARGDQLPVGNVEIWRNLIRSLVKAARSFTTPFVIVTESYGSLLAERLYEELSAVGEAHRVAGILHTPPTLDLLRVFRTVMEMGIYDFQATGDHVRESQMAEFKREVDLDPRIDSPALLAGIDLAFQSSQIMMRYFRNLESLGRWAGGFAAPGFAPDSEMRDRILKGIGAVGASVQTTFAPDVPTMVCVGGFDPYEKLSSFEDAIAKAMVRPGRKSQIAWAPFPERGHYPYSDELERWVAEAWEPFLHLVHARPRVRPEMDREIDPR